MSNFFENIGKAVQEAKSHTTAINLPIQVIKYEKIGDKDYVTGINLLTIDQEEPEMVKAFLLEDKQAAKRSKQRTSLQQRQHPNEDAYVGEGGILIMERAYRQNDGTYAANWTASITPDKLRGAVQKCVISMVFNESTDPAKKPSVRINWFNPSKAVLVETETQLREAVFMATEAHIPSTTPQVMVRAIFNNQIHAAIIVRSRGNKDSGYALTAFDDAYAIFENSPIGQAIHQAISQQSDDDKITFEVIRGGYGYFPPLQRDRFFSNGRLIESSQFNQISEGRILKDLFQPQNGMKHDQLYCEGILGIKVTKEKANSDPWPFYRYAKSISSQPRMFEAQYMPTTNFQPQAEHYRTTTITAADESGDTPPEEQETPVTTTPVAVASPVSNDQLPVSQNRMNAAPGGSRYF